jgi:L-cysteine:1D-myo-inositol 2-amino-2-deoxy-alpha-D-glucopyranoside ligase
VLKAGQQRLARWREAVARGRGPAAGPVVAAVRSRLADDLDTPGALAAVDAWAEAALAGTGSAPVDEVGLAVDALLGVRL